jgi:hypothetical protein
MSHNPLIETNIQEELDLTTGEKDLLRGAETGNTSQINKTRIYANIYLTKKLHAIIDDLIQSNERLSESNDRYAKAMNWLTFGLLLVAALQTAITIYQLFFAK